MKSSRVPSVRRVTHLAAALGLVAVLASGAPPVLRWDPSVAGNAWNATATNWLDAGANAVAWIPGAEATFEGAAGGLVQIAADVYVTNLTFTGNGYILLGAGRLQVEGAISVGAATTNSVAAELATVGGLTKTGAGALSLARCAGPLAVQTGTLLASGSLFADAELSVASGASLVTLGEPDAAANLLLNPGFEAPVVNNWGYTVPSNWTATALSQHVGLKNTTTAGEWADANASPEGVQMMILQYSATVAQTVTVPADGLYSIAFSHLLRRGYPENRVYVTLDGCPLATFLNRGVQFSPGRFASAALWLKAGSHTLGIGGEGYWGDRTSLIDAACFAPPAAGNASRALAGDSLLKLVAGASVRLSHTGTLPLAYVSIDGATASGTFDASHASGIFSGSGALSCAAPGNVYTWSGSGLWSSAARWADGAAPAAGGSQNLLLRFPLAAGTASTNDLAGEFLTRRLWAAGLAADGSATLAGAPLVFTNSAPRLTLTAPGTWTLAAPVLARATLTLESDGELIVQGNPLGLASNSTFYKSGPGRVTFPSFTNLVAGAVIYDGTVQTPQLPSSLAINLLTQSGKGAALTLTQGGVTFGNAINLMGSGTPALRTRFGGAAATLTGYPRGYGDVAEFDVGAGDTLSLPQMLLQNVSRGNSVAQLLKTGAGTLEIRGGGTDNSNNRAYQGRTVLRNGTLKVSEDDYGTLSGVTNPFNGRTYSGNGGSLGYSGFTNAFMIGDSGTAPSDALAFIANGNGRWIGHDIEIFNRGSTVTLGLTTGTAMFANTITLHRDIVLAGPADGVLAVSNVVAAGDYAGTGLPAFSGLAGLRVEGAFPAVASLSMGARGLRFGTYAVRAQTLNALSLGTPSAAATLDVDFGAGVNDTVAVTQAGGLTLSNTVVNLYYAGTGLPFAEPGTYTLFTYAGTLGGDAALLSVGNPQSGAGYAFANDAGNSRVTLTISGSAGGLAAVWKSALGGSWGTGANWDSGLAPNGSGAVPLFGLAITNDATVDTGAGYTVGGLVFNNASYGYTLAGSGGLTLATNGATPQITVSAGTHAIDTALGGSSGVAVSAASGAVLALGGSATVGTDLNLTQGTLELRGHAAVNGATTLAAGTLLRASNTTNATVATLSGAASSAVSLTGSAPRLTVSQATDGTFAGLLSGAADAQLIKSGSGTLTLNGTASPFLGQASISGGTLALQSATLPAAVAVGAAGTLSVAAPATNGLTGFYYSVAPNTNNFWTFAGMEAHFATLTPTLASLSGLQNTAFDFGTAGALFPQPYGSGGSRTTQFEVAYRGTITLPESGTYVFGAQGDDGFILAIDGQTVLGRNANGSGWLEGTVRLDAGRYDIVLGYFQLTGGYGLQLRVKPPSATAAVLVPSTWLTPYTAFGTLTGDGAFAHAASNAASRIVQTGISGYRGAFSGAAGSLLTKAGNGTLALDAAGAGSFDGDIEVQGGTLALAASGRLGDASALRVRGGATLSFAGQETVGALAGNGTLALGGYVYNTPFTGDADCGVSSAKTYTHLIDFPTGTYAPVINGVTFGNTGAWSFSGNAPTGTWNEAPNDATRTGIDSLLRDFNYGTTNFTLNLSGLTSNKVYEARLYFRNFASNPRNLVITFTAGSTLVGSLAYNPDTVTRSIVACRFRADAAQSLAIQVVSLASTDTCHLYGLSNEEVTDAAQMALTLAPAAGRSSRFAGAVTGNGALVKEGAGTQRFSGASTLSTPLDVRAGTAVLDVGASLAGGASVAAGAVLRAPLGNVTLGALAGAGTFELTGSADYAVTNGPHFKKITGDADCGISADKRYTHLIDFGSSTALATVNGVTFNKERTINGPAFGCSWLNAPVTSAMSGGNTGNIGVSPTQGLYNLINDFCYGGPYGPTVMTLTGLTVGKTYEVRFYHRKWEADKARTTTFTFDPDGAGPISDAITFNPDSPAGASNYNDNYLAYRYFAQTNRLAVTITCPNPDRYHIYGLSNEEVPGSMDGAATLDIAGDSVFDGAITGAGRLTKTGAGSFTVTGASTATGPVAVNAGAFGVAAGGCATLGPVSVAAGATIFGHGQMGGSVAVASNGWLMAGTPAVCGTLAVGGDLTLAPGARLAYRFDAGGAHDTVTVGGQLTFPTNGVVQASALTAGTATPAKQLFFSSPLVISGPDELTGWTVEGVENAKLKYGDDRKEIFFYSPRGTLVLLH